MAVPSRVIAMLACPRYVDSAFALTPAAIISDAKVCRASCIPIGVSFAFCHVAFARAAVAAS